MWKPTTIVGGKLISDEFGLSPREADVLVLLAKHMPVKAIADELFVSFNTARTHVRHVYGKLDVHSRRGLDELIDAFEID
ncbi:helix-turn-helix domain-containing protein [Slackia heliotrinireducens]|uniref:helix-turn-helix domain-containing protein n=1 Tax=Slackia heliotrinireducens TaxID=84110 RepID=UPI00331578F2